MIGVIAIYIAWIWDSVVNLDIDYLAWVWWVVHPTIILFLLPGVILLLLYASAVFLWVFQYRHDIQEAYQHDFWDGARRTLAAFWDGTGHYYFGMNISLFMAIDL